MTIRQEIREGMRKIPTHPKSEWGCISSLCLSDSAINLILSYLDSKGVVIKVERDRPKNPYKLPSSSTAGDGSYTPLGRVQEDGTVIYYRHTEETEEAYNLALRDMAGYVAVEPLI